MKRIVIAAAILCCIPAAAQSDMSERVQATAQAQQACHTEAICIIPTENMWTVLELDTRTGLVCEIQIGLKDSQRYMALIGAPQTVKGTNGPVGRFALYPTGNMYNFILVDNRTGLAWQVQWGTADQMRIDLIPLISGESVVPDSGSGTKH